MTFISAFRKIPVFALLTALFLPAAHSQHLDTRLPRFDFATNTLYSGRCVIILSDEYPESHMLGQERYFVTLQMEPDENLRLVAAEPETDSSSCVGEFDMRTGLYKTPLYYGNDIVKGPPLLMIPFYNHEARNSAVGYKSLTIHHHFNQQYGMNLPVDNHYHNYCGDLPIRYQYQGSESAAFGNTPCMINTMIDYVNARFRDFADIGVTFTLAEIVETDFPGFDMTLPSDELLAQLSQSDFAKSGYINLFFLPYGDILQGTTYLNGDLNSQNGVTIVRTDQNPLYDSSVVTAHEIGHTFGLPHLFEPITHTAISDATHEIVIPSFFDIKANMGCEYANIMSSYDGGCPFPHKFDTLIHGDIFKRVIARQLYEWGLTSQKIDLGEH